MANSAVIADGDDMTAAQYNHLREDVLDPTTSHNHQQDGTKGAPPDQSEKLCYLFFDEEDIA